MPITVAKIEVDMLSDPPRMGAMQVNFRCTGPDKNMMDHAAIALGMTQAEFLRHVSIKAARFVIKQRDEMLGEDAPKDGLVNEIRKEEALNESGREQDKPDAQ